MERWYEYRGSSQRCSGDRAHHLGGGVRRGLGGPEKAFRK